MAHHQDPESVPLLADQSTIGRAASPGVDQSGLNPGPPIIIRAAKWQTRSPWVIVCLAAAAKFTITLSGTMFLLPFFRILEDGFCHRYNNDKSADFLDEMQCKDPEIQKNLAYFLGWYGLVNAIFSLIVALPYGILADRLGRKPAFIFSYAGVCVAFTSGPLYMYFFRDSNPYWMLPACLLQVFGGGVPVAMSILYAMAADVTSEKDRGASFLILMFGNAAGGLLGPPLAGKLMELVSPWLPMSLVMILAPFVFLAVAFIPETLQRKKADHDTDPLWTAIEKHVSKSFKELGQSFGLLKNFNIVLVMTTFFIQSPLMVAYSTILVQYVSEHFGWTIAQTSYLLSPLGVLNLVILAGLPALAELLVSEKTHHRIRLSPFGKDAFLSRLTLVFLIGGAIIEFLSGSLAVFIFGLFIGTFGGGLSPLGRALLTHYVDSEHTSRLMSLISMVETIGSFFGGPLLAYWFDVGHRKGKGWTGLPFLYIAFLCTVALVCLLLIREPPRKIQDDTDTDTDDEATVPYSDEPRLSAEPDAPLS